MRLISTLLGPQQVLHRAKHFAVVPLLVSLLP